MASTAAGSSRSPSGGLPNNADECLNSDVDYIVLKELARNLGPVGCWTVHSTLQVAGIAMSEASAGRLLRRLDQRGLTQPLGSKGRLLTEKGRQCLAAAEQARARSSYQNDLLEAIQVDTIEDILDILQARRAIEAETARQAALRATEAEVAELELAVARHIDGVRSGHHGSEHNRLIHTLIAQASKSRVLLAVVNLILQDRQLHEIQSHIQRTVGEGGVAPEEHYTILQAITKRDPEEAATAMQAHMDRLIRVMRAHGSGPVAQLRAAEGAGGNYPQAGA
ncbi:MAG: FadR/GntR family transcriptional regulator [Chloroflexota bacterium]